MKRALIYLLACQILFTLPVWAQEKGDSLKVYYLDEVVVTAKRTETKLRDCSASISLLTEKDIESSNSNNAIDVLNFLPGVFIQKTGDFGRADIDIRGIGSRGTKILILVDGKPEKMGLYGCAVTHSLPLSNVERVELVRGPASVLYGSDALGGVVNIITKGGEKNETDYTFSYGSFDTYVNRVRAGAHLGKVDFYATADKRKSSGHLANSAYEGEEYSLKMGHLFSQKTKGDLMARYFKGHKEEPLPSPAGTWNDYERAGLDYSLEHTVSSSWKGVLKMYHNWGEHLFSDGWHSKDRTLGVFLQLDGNPGKNNHLTSGVEFKNSGGERLSAPVGKWDRDESSIFLQDEQLVFKGVLLSLGARYTYDQISADDLSSHAGLVLNPWEKTLVRLSINKGFRSPQINELYMFPSSNENLKPEEVWSYEAGINQTVMSGISLDLTGFVMNGDNLIETGENPSPPPLYLFQNSGKFDFKGVELGIRIEERKLNGQIYYSHLDPKNKTQGRPEDKISVRLGCELGRISSSLNGQYVWNYYAQDDQKERIGDFLVMDSKISYNLASYFEFFLGVQNIFDEPYQIYVNLPSGSGLYTMPPRSFSVGFKITR